MKPDLRSAQSRMLKRLGLGLSYCLSLASVLAISAEAIAVPVSPEAIQKQTAQETAQQTAQSTDQETAQASSEATPAASEAARLKPFFNLSHTEGGGFTGFTSVGGFLPLLQTPGQNVTFLDGRVNVDNEGNFGGGLQAGYRALLNDSIIWGAYAGVDASSTGDSSFTQATAGTELLGENWDLTLNANIPLGNARQVIDSDIQAVNPQFTGNQLLIDEQQIDQVQAALTTVSLDAGLELFDFGEGSGLWGRGGVYYLAGEASEDSLGFRASLDYRATNSLRFGAGVQNDGVFGTNAIFSVSASIGGRSRRSYDNDENSTERRDQLWARAAEPINRTNTVLVENRTDVEIVQEDVAAINPDTGNEFVFRHVDPSANGMVNGLLAEEIIREGTFEDPLSTIAQAANVADANADNIIFVQEGNAGGSFTLPDGVQVRSVGPVQQLNTQFGEVILPGSGSGNLPTVTGQVTIGNNTLISGLEIDPTKFANGEVAAALEPPVVNGIEANGENITLEDNVIANVDTGINLPDIDGTVSIVRNQISNTNDEGISFGDITGEDNATVTIADNTLETIDGDGIEFGFIEGDAIANITVANNQITDTRFAGIFFDDIQGNAAATIAVEGNIINAENGDADEGIEFNRIEDNANATITVNNNQISNVGNSGIFFDSIENDTVSTITIENNNLLNTGEGGIFLDDIEDNANATITVSGNQINTVDFSGIEFARIENNANATITMNGNQISNVDESGNAGILFDDIEDTATAVITVDSNTITDSGDDGIEFGFIEGDSTADITVTGNQLSNVQGDNIFFEDIEGNAIATITVTDNVINGGKNGVEFRDIEDDANATITISNNQINDVVFEGIDFFDIEDDTNSTISITNNQITSGKTSIDLGNIENSADATITITGNTLTSEERGGIFVNDLENNTVSNILIEENTILSAATEGIEFDDIENNADATIRILNNQVFNAAEEGIAFGDIENTTTSNITVSGNTITDVGTDGIKVDLVEDGASAAITVTNNTITNPGGNGVSIEHIEDANICLALDNNTVTTPGGDGFNLLSNGAGQFQVIDLANVTSRNVGSFNPADIEENDAFVEGTAGQAPCL
ncbi:MAG: beta strand repeat-containing protein [Phormidesmis sp.]